jgi:hypothetical protein
MVSGGRIGRCAPVSPRRRRIRTAKPRRRMRGLIAGHLVRERDIIPF